MGLADELALRAPGRSPLARAIRGFAASRAGAWALAPTLRHLDRWTLWLTGGRTTFSDGPGGVPTLFLTTTGARTGQPRTAQLIAVPAGTDLAVIGSNFGRASSPAWVANLNADPRAVAGCHGRSVAVVARELTGAEAEAVWAAGRDLYRGFATYPQMAAGRSIRVFRLELARSPGRPDGSATSAEPSLRNATPRARSGRWSRWWRRSGGG
jgi:deazaflavin-dependent oxidoreductase (nitroreductase family)